MDSSTKDLSPAKLSERPNFRLRGVGRTDVGHQRTHNEDALYVDDELRLYLVCDGMGGHASGAIASQLAVDTIVGAVRAAAPARNAGEAVLPAAIHASNSALLQRSANDPACRGMGTTAVGLLAERTLIHLVHVGDSRIYLMREGQLRLLTRDHSLENLYRDKPELTGQLGPPNSNVIVRAIGLEQTVEVDHLVMPMQANDLYLLACDGLTDLVTDQRIHELLVSSQTLEEAADALIREANACGGADNITVVLVALFQQSETKRDDRFKTMPGF